MEARQYTSLAFWARDRKERVLQTAATVEGQQEEESAADEEESGSDVLVLRPDWWNSPRAA